MKIAIFGGTGSMGQGLAALLSKSHEVLIASRDPGKARQVAAAVAGATGTDYGTAAEGCEAAVVAIPFSALGSLSPIAGALTGKLVISMVNPLKTEGGVFRYALERGSAAESLGTVLPNSRVATAFNNIPSSFFSGPGPQTLDVVVCADTRATYDEAAVIVRSIPNLRPLYGGPLRVAADVERITPLILNLAKWNAMGSIAPRFVSREAA